MQNRSYLFLLLVIVLGGLSGWLFTLKKFKYGLDVSGGIRLTYQLDFSKLSADQRAHMGDAADRVVSILEKRAQGMGGATEATVQRKGNDQVIVEIPGATNIEEARVRMGSSARIYMYHAKTLSTDSFPNRPYVDQPSSDANDPSVTFVKQGSGKVIKPGDPEYQTIIESWGDPILSGEDLASAGMEPSGSGYIPTMHFSPAGAQKMEAWTRKFHNTGEKLAYVLDNKVLNVAPLAPNAIISTDAQITGSFTAEYVSRLRDLLNAGALPVDLKELSYETVDPTIGNQALGEIAYAGAISFGITVLFLIAYYSFPGVVAAIALSLYVLFTLSVLKIIDATFSLAAIAGFILSMGMAVDANILVFERLKEEMKRGRTLHASIDLGFRRALPAIVDSNACTILTSLVLASLGTGPVKGFATTLIIGVAISLFTAVFVTRSLLMFFVDSGIATNPKWYAVERNWFKKAEARAHDNPMKIVERAGRWFLISAITILVTVPFFFMGGFRVNVEFQGGYEARYATSGTLQPNTVYAANLEKSGIKGGNVKLASYKAPGFITITFKDPSKIKPEEVLNPVTKQPAKDKLDAIKLALGVPDADPIGTPVDTPSLFQVKFSLDDLRVTERQPVLTKLRAVFGNNFDWAIEPDPKPERHLIYITVPPNPILAAIPETHQRSMVLAQKAGLTNVSDRGFTEVGPVVQKETIRNAILAIILSSVLIIVYLAVRFGFSLGGFVPGLRFGVSAVGALLHDVLVVVGSASLVGFIFGWEISALFITAMLTMIGFSVHDTIVVFDRIRENLRKPDKHHDLGFVMDVSITQTFARSVNTSMTVIVTLGILIWIGTATPDLKFFCVAMLVGIISGTYSSIYNASPILYLWDKAIVKKDPKKGLIGLAIEEQAKHRIVQTHVRAQAAPQVQSGEGGRSYGQVRRRASAQQKGHVDMDDEP